jgi:redox-sensing transcriptional repressor
MAKKQLTQSALERLPRYYQYVRDLREKSGSESVSSAALASFVGVDDTQVRKDLALIGVKGCPRVGYKSALVQKTICRVLGFDQPYRAIIVGIGQLGGALANYGAFALYGLQIAALFDNDPRQIGRTISGYAVRSSAEIAGFVAKTGVRLAIVTVPRRAAQEVAAMLVECGIDAIWNFSHTRLEVPAHVAVRNENLGVGLAELSYHLHR